jgi:MioC protein
MSRIVILFGTESGNAEFVADDIAVELESSGETAVADMSDFDLDEFTPEDFYVVVCSTHGEGELPIGAQPFFDALQATRPDLTGVKYSVFGLGDSTYDHYSHGSEIIDALLTELGGMRIGEYGRHDAADGSLPNDAAIEWSHTLRVFV